MKPPSALSEDFDDSDDFTLDALFAEVRQPSPADAGAAERFLSRQALLLPQAPPLVSLPRHRATWWPTLLAAAALFGGLLVLRPAPHLNSSSMDSSSTDLAASQPLASSAAYDAYSSALGGEW
ncbi:hypothetical protein EHF33_12980 [Deinococcus psychrotolerans]|uniref:Uncharacterized protein n=1 Tax=Deinococcus psychrotolerans TaxID=2489213 RepID=A0A3G8YDS9_9DEIO|nr:hypothetical protein [Deinococcus psychrotolerans]AZI43549.1 hypothetical protein EHF33_12980 [Deinococcus psychrotolerans]